MLVVSMHFYVFIGRSTIVLLDYFASVGRINRGGLPYRSIQSADFAAISMALLSFGVGWLCIGASANHSWIELHKG